MTRLFTLLLIATGLLSGLAYTQSTGAASALPPVDGLQAAEWKLKARLARNAAADSDDELVLPEVSYSPLFAMGVNGDRRYQTVILAINSTRHDVNVLVEFFGKDGQPLAVPFVNRDGTLAGYFSQAAGTLGAGVSAEPSLMMSTAPLIVGWARITCDEPGALGVRSFVSIADNFRGDVLVHKSSEAVYGPLELGVENSPSPKQTWFSIVNPTTDPVTISVAPRLATGVPACAPFELTLAAGAQLWQTAQALVKCVRAGEPNYTLRIEPLDGEVAVQAYYDYGNLVLAPAPLQEVVADDDAEAPAAVTPAAAPTVTPAAAPTAAQSSAGLICKPSFSPLKPVLTSEEQELEVTVDFDSCGSTGGWRLETSSLAGGWFHFIDDNGRAVEALTGSGSVTVRVAISAAPAKKYGGTRKGVIYLNSYTNNRVGKVIATYSFWQPVPRI